MIRLGVGIGRRRVSIFQDGALSTTTTTTTTTAPPDPPAQILSLELTPGFPPFVLAEWADPVDMSINEYAVSWRVQGDTEFNEFTTGSTALTATIGELPPSTPIEVKVAAISPAGQGDYSELASATTLLAVSPVPVDLVETTFDVYAAQAGVVLAEWTHPDNIGFYGNFHYSVLVDGVQHTTTTDDNVAITGLDNNESYDITVKTIVTDDSDIDHVSDPSNLVTMKTLIFLDLFSGGSPSATLAGSITATGQSTFIETGLAVFNSDTGIGAEWANDGDDTFESTVFFDAIATGFRCILPVCLTKGFVLPFNIYFNYDRSTLDGWKLEVFSGKYSLYRIDAGAPTEVATFTGAAPGTSYPDDNMYIDFLVDNDFISGVFTSSQSRPVDDLVYEVVDRPHKALTGFGFGICGGDLTFNDGGGDEIIAVVGTCSRIVMRQL